MIALVTGGTGFLGRRVVARLVAGGVNVRCLVRGTSDTEALMRAVPNDQWHRISFVPGDLAEPASYRAALADVDVVYHLAAGMTGGAAALFLNTVVATRTFAAECGKSKVPRFVLVSSLGVYGCQDIKSGGTLHEGCAIDPNPHLRDPYTYSKVAQEQACRDSVSAHGLNLVVIRPGVIIGPGKGALSTRFGLSLGNWSLRIGKHRRLPYTYVDNCAAAICLAGRAPNIVGEAFNIVDDDPPSVHDILSAYRRHGKRLRSIWLPQHAIGPLSSLYERYERYSRGQLPAVLSRYKTHAFWRPFEFANTKAKQQLGWSPDVVMSDALARSIRSPAQPAA